MLYVNYNEYRLCQRLERDGESDSRIQVRRVETEQENRPTTRLTKCIQVNEVLLRGSSITMHIEGESSNLKVSSVSLSDVEKRGRRRAVERFTKI